MKYWQCLAMLDMDELPILAKHAEDLGFEGVTLSQHLVTFSAGSLGADCRPVPGHHPA
jgi:alkanesulfonate monooxygenase SsuD/methylene tetrahydromethanopterin reductase-like flavin-dependent oxidoreductase (luciferase family)